MGNLFWGAILLVAIVFALLWLNQQKANSRKAERDMETTSRRLEHDIWRDTAQERRIETDREAASWLAIERLQAVIDREENKVFPDKEAVRVARRGIEIIYATGTIPSQPAESSEPHWSEFV